MRPPRPVAELGEALQRLGTAPAAERAPLQAQYAGALERLRELLRDALVSERRQVGQLLHARRGELALRGGAEAARAEGEQPLVPVRVLLRSRTGCATTPGRAAVNLRALGAQGLDLLAARHANAASALSSNAASHANSSSS